MWTFESILALFATSTFTAASVAALAFWLSKDLLSEKIKGAIRSEYDAQIEVVPVV